MTRGPILLAGALTCFVIACGKKADDGAAMTGDSVATVAPAATAPAELLAASDQEVAAWNQEDPNVVGASYTDSVVAHIDTMAEMHGRTELVSKWVKPNLPLITTLTADSITWTPAGSDFQGTGRFHITGVGPDKKPMTMNGTFNHNWTKGADGKWLTSVITITTDAPPPPPSVSTAKQ